MGGRGPRDNVGRGDQGERQSHSSDACAEIDIHV